MTKPSKPAIVPPTSNKGGSKPSAGGSASDRMTSAALALNMAWQLLLVIVLPTVGGHLLDGRYHTFPIWTCVGMAVALAATVIVVTQTVRQLNVINGTNEGEDKS